MQQTAQTIAVGGENLIDHITQNGAVSTRVGGSPFNVAMALGRQGAQVRYLSPISSDHWGDELAHSLQNAGVTLSGGRVDLPTTVARVVVQDGLPSYMFERDGTAERAIRRSTLAQQMQGVGVLHTGSIALSEGPDAELWEQTAQDAHGQGTFVSLDPNVRLSVVSDPAAYRDRVLRMFEAVDLLKMSDDDLKALFPEQHEEAAIDHVIRHSSAALIVLTRGELGASAWLGNQEDTNCAALRIDVQAAPVTHLVDTVGAGDTFMATLLAGLVERGNLSRKSLSSLSSEELSALLHRCARAAAMNCAREGCDPPFRHELDGNRGTERKG